MLCLAYLKIIIKENSMGTVNSQSFSVFKICLWYICSQNPCPRLYLPSPRNLYRSLQIFTVAHRIKPCLAHKALRVRLLITSTLSSQSTSRLDHYTPSFFSLNIPSPSPPTDFEYVPSSARLSPHWFIVIIKDSPQMSCHL